MTYEWHYKTSPVLKLINYRMVDYDLLLRLLQEVIYFLSFPVFHACLSAYGVLIIFFFNLIQLAWVALNTYTCVVSVIVMHSDKPSLAPSPRLDFQEYPQPC